MSGRVHIVGRALGALVCTAVLVAGVPLMLIRLVGNPFPDHQPSIDEIRILLTQNGEGFTNFVIGTLAVAIWFIWAQLMLALVVEIVATLRRRETRRLPTIPGVQILAARLVASLTLATTLLTSPGAAPAVAGLAFVDLPAAPYKTELVIDLERTDLLGGAGLSADSSLAAVPDIEDPVVATIVSADRTELWDLADAAYGDGLSWKRIARANVGAFDARGEIITADTEAVAAGTTLRLVGSVDVDAVAAFGQMANLSDDDPSRHVVESGESMWSVAEQVVEEQLGRPAADDEIGEYWASVVAANDDVPSGDVDLIHPGDELVLPARAPALVAEVVRNPTRPDTTAAPEDEPSDADTRRSGAAVPGSAGVSLDGVIDGPSIELTDQIDLADDVSAGGPGAIAVTPHGTDDVAVSELDPLPPEGENGRVAERLTAVDTSSDGGSVPAPAVGMAAMGAALLSAGVVGALRRRRDLQRRTRPAGTIARAPSSAATAFEAAMAHAGDQLRTSSTGLGWRMLPASAVPGWSSPDDGASEEGTNGHVILSPVDRTEWTGHVPPPPFDPADSADSSEDETNGAAVTDGDGQTVEDRVDPGTAGAVDTAASAAILIGTDPSSDRAVLLDLCSAGGALELVGDAAAVRRVARSVVLDLAVSERCDDVCVIAVGVGGELDDLERVRIAPNFAQALAQTVRSGHAGSDSGTPVVVVGAVAPEPDDDSIAALGRVGAMIVAPGIASLTKLHVDGDRAEIEPTGEIVQLAAFDDEQYRFVAELVDSTRTGALELVDGGDAVERVLDVVAVDSCALEPGPVEVKVLGPVTIMGADSFSSLKAVDVVTYLAFHRHGVDADQIKSWVWPAFEPPTDKAFANVMSRARTGLGADDDGTPYLSRAGADRTYRLSEQVTTDFDRFRALIELAEQADDTASTVAILHQALELIRGVPFTGGAASSFAWADNHVRARVEYTIDEAVHRCADLALDIGDLGTARAAVLRGLELVPGCEQCFRRRFLIARADNNRSELRRAMADLEASAIIDLGEPEAVDVISGELLDLYHELDQALVGRT